MSSNQPLSRAVLVIAGSGIGNILLATPIIRSLRSAWPDVAVDVIVPEGRGEILVGNSDVRSILSAPKGAGIRKQVVWLSGIYRRYEWALSARAGDRSLIQAWVASRQTVAHVRSKTGGHAWVKWAIRHRIGQDMSTHAVLHGLRLLEPLGVPALSALVPPPCGPEASTAMAQALGFDPADTPYAVVHPCARNVYKNWTVPGWQALIHHFFARGIRVVMTGSPVGLEGEILGAIRVGLEGDLLVDVSGRLSLAQIAELYRNALVYVGPDTGLSHLAAATGTPCVVLFGPSEFVYWSPWPIGYAEQTPPFTRRGCQRVGNVSLVQNQEPCVGCGREGCNNNTKEATRCMLALPVSWVIRAVDEHLDESPRLTAAPAPVGSPPL